MTVRSSIYRFKSHNSKFDHLDKLIIGQCHKYREYDSAIVANFGDSNFILLV